jgi:hypothetical protein
MFSNIIFNIIARIKIYARSKPFIVKFYLIFFRRSDIITAKNNILIGGAPRTTNTYSGRMLRYNQKGLNLVHHFHSPGQAIISIRKKIPAIIIIRNPLETTSSLLLKERRLSLGTALLMYYVYYSTLKKYVDSILFVDSEVTINNFNLLIEEINSRYHLKLLTINNLQEAKDKVVYSLYTKDLPKNNTPLTVSGPTVEKQRLKQKLEIEILKNKKYLKCLDLYNKILENSLR